MKPLPISPGPWHWVANHPDDACAYVRDGTGQEVAVVYGSLDKEKRNADAALLAASRYLLAVAECCVALDMPLGYGDTILERHGWRPDYPISRAMFVHRIAEAALAKVNQGPVQDLSPPRSKRDASGGAA